MGALRKIQGNAFVGATETKLDAEQQVIGVLGRLRNAKCGTMTGARQRAPVGWATHAITSKLGRNPETGSPLLPSTVT